MQFNIKTPRNLVLATLLGTVGIAGNALAGAVVDQVVDANTLAQNIAGSGITVSNVVYTGAQRASGTYTGGTSADVDIDKGVVLSTGRADAFVGVNDTSSTSTSNNTAGDARLSNISGSTTEDAASLAFDFEFDGGAGGDLFFNFIFGSEEYNEYVNVGFNDVFAFYLDGVNVATLPDGSPVSIDTVNNGVNSAYFNDNDFQPGPYNNQMDGFTSAIQVAVAGLSAGLHTMEFVIADSGDSSYDSWVLIESGSFSDTPIAVAEPGTIPMLGLGILGLFFTRRRLKVSKA